MSESKTKKISRRDAIKLLGAAAGASVLANLPTKWNTPELTTGVLPAHAQTSTVQNVGCPGLGLTVTLQDFASNTSDVDLTILTPGGFLITPKPSGVNQGTSDPFTGATHSGDGNPETITVPVGNLTNGTWTITVTLISGGPTPVNTIVTGACSFSDGSPVLSSQSPVVSYQIDIVDCQAICGT